MIYVKEWELRREDHDEREKTTLIKRAKKEEGLNKRLSKEEQFCRASGDKNNWQCKVKSKEYSNEEN